MSATGPSGTDRGLNAIVRVLEDAGVRYWIDSGVLLGLVRSGKLNEWEKDIDLGVCGDQIDALVALAPVFRRSGYRTAVKRFRGTVFSFGIKPTPATDPAGLRCSIHVFYPIGSMLWSPQVELYQPPPTPDVYRGRRTVVGRALKHVIDRWFEPAPDEAPRASRMASRENFWYRFVRAVYRGVDLGWLAETWPVSEVFVPLTWLVPVDLVLPLGTLEVSGVTYPVPGRLDGYLTHRYGNWRVPVRDWCYWEDDGAIRRERPFALRARLLREAERAGDEAAGPSVGRRRG